jgi:hypothetical protein
MSRFTRTLLVTSLFVVPLTARPAGPPAYQVVATLPNVVDGQPLRTLIFDREARRLYAGSQFGLYGSDLSGAEPVWQGPIVRKNIRKIEVAPDLGRVFYAAVDEVGYVDAAGGGAVKISAGNASDLVYEPTQHELYVAFERTSAVLVFDARTGQRRQSVALPGWNAFELEAIPGRVFLFVGGKDGIYAIDASTHRLSRWPVAGHLLTPGALEADPGGRYLFLARNEEIDAIDIATSKLVGRVTGMRSTPAVGFDPGTGLLVAMWTDVQQVNKIVAIRPDAGGLTDVNNLTFPSIGSIGVEPTNHGFIQAGDHAFIVWSSERTATGSTVR